MTRFGLLLFTFFCGFGADESVANSLQETFRRPVALAWASDDLLVVANRDTGSISVLDANKRRVIGEVVVGKRLSSLSSLLGTPFLVAADEEANELLLLESKGATVAVRDRISVPHSPVNVLVSKDNSFAVVASLWARQVSLIRVDVDRGKLFPERVTNLPFPPRGQWMDAVGRKLVLTDAFSDQLAALRLPELDLVSVRSLPGHNIGGIALAPDGKELLFSHQSLNPFVPTTRPRVFWGSVMQNGIAGLAVKDIFDSTRSPNLPFARRKHYPVGQNGKGAGEPGPMAFTSRGELILGIRGTGEIAVAKTLNAEWVRIAVGRRPVAVVLDANHRFAYFADIFGDAIRVVEISKHALAASISLGPTPKPGLLQVGEILFHNSQLSLDGWYSCNSCHTGGHTSGMRNDNFDDHSFGTPKRIPSLLGTAETGPWTWNGLQGSLTLQVRQSLATTLLNPERKHGLATRDDEEALVSYLFTLPLPPPLSAARREEYSPEITKGKLLFDKLGCNECHRFPLLTSPDEYDVGLHDEAGFKKFNPPSLHGVSQRDHFFHDGSASTLKEVLNVSGHPDGGNLTQRQLNQLIAYLRTL
tara:strand:+ start:254 stop:2017 length:1764 start_codon:yes stop_codon:yes gene_type:complete